MWPYNKDGQGKDKGASVALNKDGERKEKGASVAVQQGWGGERGRAWGRTRE